MSQFTCEKLGVMGAGGQGSRQGRCCEMHMKKPLKTVMKITHSYCNECLADKKQKVFFLPPSLSLSPPLTEKYFGTFASIFFFSFYFTKLRPVLLQEGGPLPGPESGLLSNTQK